MGEVSNGIGCGVDMLLSVTRRDICTTGGRIGSRRRVARIRVRSIVGNAR